MKKLLTMVLALALLAGMAAIPALAETKLLSWNGLEVWVTDYSYNESDGGYTYIHMDVRISNGTDHTITVLLEDVMIDGTAIYGAGFSKIAPGSEATDWMLFKPNDDNMSGGDGAIRTGSQIDMTMRVSDSDTREKLYVQDVSINLYDLSVSGGDSGDYGDDIPADFGHGGASSASYAPAYTPASTDYKTLKQGSKGQAVRDLQQRLTDLGYLNDRVDGSYGRNTNTAVRDFCAQNGLAIGSQATPEMQSLLYSSSAKYYEEQYLPLMIAGNFNLYDPYHWGNDNSAGALEVEIVNRSSTQSLRGYVLSYYQTDMYGNKVDITNGRGIYEYESEMMNHIEPGHYEKAYPFVINNYYRTYAVYVGVKKVVLGDGTVHEVDSSQVTYFECVIAN